MKFDLNKNPIDLFTSWLDEAKITEPNDPDAMSFATVSSDGYPSVRMVLLRKFDKKGFIFFTNYNSRKSNEINVNSKGALCFHWKSLRRQVRAVGNVERATEQESDDSRETLLKRVKEYEDRFEDKPPRPEFWGGFRLIPKEIEFWSDGKFRLHDRFRFVQVKNEWKSNRLYP